MLDPDEDENEQAGKEAYSGYDLVEPTAAPPPATGTGTSTGTTSLTVASVTGTIQLPSAVTGTGVPAGTTIISQSSGTRGGAGFYVTSASTTLTAIALTFTPSSTAVFFPDFVPILPPPLVGQGSGSTPPFPPPSIPPPAGPLVGPAIAAAGVPPSTAGITQPIIAGSHPAVFPDFSTTWPNPPVQGSTTQPPPSLPTTAPIRIGGQGPPQPPVNTAAPVISGSLSQGSVLTATNGTWTGVGTLTYTYSWLTVPGGEIPGATASTWTISGYIGDMVMCQVTASNATAATTATSNQLGPITS